MFGISKNGVTDIPRRDKDKINHTVFYLEDTTATLNSNDWKKTSIFCKNRNDLQSKLERDRYEFVFVNNDNQEGKDDRQGSDCFTVRIFKWMDITERNIAEREKTRVAKELQTFIDTANAPIFGRSRHLVLYRREPL